MGNLLDLFVSKYNRTDFHELNLDWLITEVTEMINQVENFVSINAVKYADPIQWDITRQYEKNTIVIDPLTGTAYISVASVPSGVALTRDEYWTVVFDLGSFVTRAAKNFTTRYEQDTTTTATFPTTAGEWLVWGDTLYVANVNITAGDSYVVDGNIRRITIEEVKNEIYTTFNNMIGALADLDTTDKSNLVAAINEVLSTLLTTTGALADLDTTDKSNLVAAINEVLSTLLTTTGALADLDTTDKSNLVAAINEVLSTLLTTTGALADLDTTDKSNLVAAINEVNIKASAATYYVTPEDYGAQGGNADDTLAIQAAINDGRPVIFTQNYNITSITIPNDSSRTIHIDGNNRWLNYIGDGSETAAVIMKGVNVTIENLNINNTTSHEKIGMYWTSDDAAHPSEFNYIRGMNIYNFNTGIFYGDINGVLDTSQSENYVINYNTRGCHLPIYMFMENAILLVDSSNLICSHAESTYTWDDSSSGIARVENGLLIITNSELVKPDITSGFGIQGKNVHIDNCAIEIASVWANCSGDVTFSNISAGYFGGGNVLSPFNVYPDADGVLTLDNVDLRIGTLSNVPLVGGLGGYPSSFWCNIINSKFNNRIWNYATPICDCPFTIKNTVINNALFDDQTYTYNALNYTDLTNNAVTLTIDNTGNIVVTANNINPSTTTEEFKLSTLLDFSIDVSAISGTWNAILVVTAPDGTLSYPNKALHTGINDLPLMFGAIAAKSAKLSITGTSATDSITIRKIVVNSNGIK